MSPLDRRAFLRGLAAAMAAVPASVTTAAAARADSGAGPSEWKRTACPLCPVACGLLVRIQNGRATAVKGDPDSPVSGGLACARGYHSVQALYGRDRITHALLRRNGAHVRVPLSEALDAVAQRLRETVTKHGKDSVALYGSAEWAVPDSYTAAKLFKGGLGTNNVDGEMRLSSASARAGLVSSFGLDGAIGCADDIDDADVIVLWNENIAETAPVLFSRMLARRRTHPGMRIIDLTTRTTRTSYAADRSLLHAPYSQIALANAICHDIASHDGVNRHFIERHVAFRKGRTGMGYGLGDDILIEDEPAAASLSEFVAFLGAYSPDRAQPLTGVRPEDIRWLASLYADRSLRVLSVRGTGVNRHARGTWLNNALNNIHLLVGKIATPGNGMLCVADGSSDAGSLTHTLPRGIVASEPDRQRAARVWQVPATRLAPRAAHSAVGMFRALESGAIRFLWIQSADPLASLPNADRYRRAATRADRFVVVSDAYPTPTTDLADVVLPSSLWLERESVREGLGRRLQHQAQLVPPPGDAIDDAWQLIEVARRIGLGELFPWSRGEHARAAWEEYRRFHADPHVRLPSHAALSAAPALLWPLVNGRETRWRYNTAHDPAADAVRGDFDFYGHDDHRAWIWLRPHEPAAEAPDREYAYALVTGDVLEHAGTGVLTRRIPTLHRAVPQAYAELNAEDARALGIRSGDRVRLVSRRGSLELDARIDHRSQPPRGQVFVPAFDEAHPVNVLTLDACCPLSGQPVYGCAVRIERVTSRSAP